MGVFCELLVVLISFDVVILLYFNYIFFVNEMYSIIGLLGVRWATHD